MVALRSWTDELSLPTMSTKCVITDERQWLSAGYAWHSRPRPTTSSSNLRNGGDESGWAPLISSPEGPRSTWRANSRESSSRWVSAPRDDPPEFASRVLGALLILVSRSQPPRWSSTSFSRQVLGALVICVNASIGLLEGGHRGSDSWRLQRW